MGNTGKRNAPWYRTPVDHTTLKHLVQTNDRIGLVYLGGFVAALGCSGYLAFLSIDTLWSIPAFLTYGGVWVFATTIVHETSHGTAFRSRWLNETVLFLAGVLVQQTPTGLRWTHIRHHNYTAMVDKDVELVLANPLSWRGFLWGQLCDVNSIFYYVKLVVLLSIGQPDQEHRDCLSKMALRRACWEARAFLLLYTLVILWSILLQTWWPVLIFLCPRIAGAPVHGVILATQHIGLAQNARDHRMTTRTMLVNPLLRFIYWNMNYHIEHHMYRMVPFHALPALHNEIKHDCPQPTRGVHGALKEMFDTVTRQQFDPNYSLPRVINSS